MKGRSDESLVFTGPHDLEAEGVFWDELGETCLLLYYSSPEYAGFGW